ncbi:MAG: hypothetical protein PVI90_06015 [Desulfobacteraceae bacterium]|jgi:hypothetical protein
MKKFITFQIVVWIIISSINSLAYEVDKDFLYKEESIYQSSKLKVDISIDHSTKVTKDTDATSESQESNLEVNIGAIRKVERPILGYWIDAAFEYAFEQDETSFEYDNPYIEDTTNRLKTNTYRIKEFEEIYEGFLHYDYCDLGIKRYLSEQSPFYIFGQGLFYWEKIDSNSENATSTGGSEDTENSDPEILAGAGFGYGKIVDLGSYERILIVQNELFNS